MGLLDNILGQVTGQSANASGGGGGGASALLPALMAIMAAKSGGGSGGLGALGGMLGNAGGAAPAGGGGIGGMLGGLMGGGAPGTQGGSAGGLGSMLGGGGVAGGLSQLLQSFEQNGHGTAAQSWVGNGANASVSPDQVGQALGPDTVDQLASHTGMSHGDVTSQLAQLLPHAVHRLTPNGRLPTEDETSQWV